MIGLYTAIFEGVFMKGIYSFIAMLICISPLAADSLPTTPFPGTAPSPSAPRRASPAPTPVQEAPKPLPRIPAAAQAVYTHPGSLVFKQGTWEGYDHLYNLTNQIGVVVEIEKPENLQINLSDQQLKATVEDLLRKGGITPLARNDENEPGLPFLHIQILIYPIGRNYAVVYQERLFEAVSIKRVNFDRGAAFQGITWEKQSLVVLPADQLIPFTNKKVVELTNSFVQLFQTYESKK